MFKTINRNRLAACELLFCCACLLAIPAEADDAKSSLLTRLTSTNLEIRMGALTNLNLDAPEIQKVVPVILNLAGSSNVDESADAIRVLSCLKPIPDGVGPILLNVVRDAGRDPAKRYQAAQALFAMRPLPEGSLSACEKLLQDHDEKLKLLAITTLKDFKAKAANAVPVLIQLYPKETDQGRLQIIYCLGYIGSPVRPAVSLLAQALTDPDKAGAAVWSLSVLGTNAGTAAPALMEVVRNQGQSERMRFAAAVALNSVCPRCRETVPVWVGLLKEKDTELRSLALDTLKNFDPDISVPALRIALTDPEPLIRSGAADYLGTSGDRAIEAVPDLKKLLADPAAIVRQSAASALEKIDRHK